MRNVRVLELSGSLAGAYCGRMFAAAGSDVVLVEPPDGGPLRNAAPWVEPTATGGEVGRRSALHEYLDSQKRSVVLEVGEDGDRELDAALGWADVVISTSDGDPDATQALHQRIVAADPATVHVVHSGFGLTGPYARWRTSALVDWASSGYLYTTGEPDREPVQGGGPWLSYLAGATGAIGAQAALLESARTGRGQLVDAAAMEAGAAAHQWSFTMYTHTGVVKRRWGLRFGESFHPMGLYRCREGWICIATPTRDLWENLCITVEAVELLADEDLYAPAVRFDRADEVDQAIESWTLQRTATEAVAALQEARVPASQLLTFSDVLESEQLASRSFWQQRPDLHPTARQPGAPFGIASAGPFRPAPALGTDTEAFLAELARADERRPLPVIDLAQVRVVECTVAWAGPLAARFLGDLGAEVIKVEHPTSRGLRPRGGSGEHGPGSGWRRGTLPDPRIRAQVFPDAVPGERPWNRMGAWNKMNRNKQSLCLDAKPDPGRTVLHRLLASADVVLHNFTPRGATSLGIDPDTVSREHPHLVSVALTGYGETGPMASHSSYGPILEAYAGFDEATGYRGEGPMRLGLAAPDPVGGVHGAFAVVAALWERAATGEAVHVDLSQLETLLCFAGELLLDTSVRGRPPERIGNRSRQHAPQGVYPCLGQDRWVALTVRGDDEWRALLELVRDPLLDGLADAGVAERRAQHDLIDEHLSAWTARHSADQAAALLQRAGVPACPPFTNRELVESEHLAARGFLATWDQPDVGLQTFPGFPLHFERTTVELRPAPPLGGHNGPVLQSLGYDEPAIADLESAGVIATRPPS